MVIAVDFDGTIVENEFPSIGKLKSGISGTTTLLDELVKLQEIGNEIILWTCRCGNSLQDAVSFCAENGLVFNAINDDLPRYKELFAEGLVEWQQSGRARKVFADLYIDDKAVNIECSRGAFLDWLNGEIERDEELHS